MPSLWTVHYQTRNGYHPCQLLHWTAKKSHPTRPMLIHVSPNLAPRDALIQMTILAEAEPPNTSFRPIYYLERGPLNVRAMATDPWTALNAAQ